MSRVVSVRLPDELAVKLEGQDSKAVIIEALRKHFNPPVQRKKGMVMEEGLPAPVGLVSPEMRYRKPPHASDCKCWICRPPNEARPPAKQEPK